MAGTNDTHVQYSGNPFAGREHTPLLTTLI